MCGCLCNSIHNAVIFFWLILLPMAILALLITLVIEQVEERRKRRRDKASSAGCRPQMASIIWKPKAALYFYLLSRKTWRQSLVLASWCWLQSLDGQLPPLTVAQNELAHWCHHE